mmetsp:Transcript_10690/g.23576  ORF Transcript_10690/g.23576 Transcript_10690/m.23576 type:complete len:569 (-) Transcript_10690:106-1812(-)|eukprot:CAMPEP_0206459318 /NCGR_PEP_ID=MMETSP0324_2-20121206/24105_1 /ASSEMBLY_ACC=CAM_ASM_000836 /TAXON_ID=2866 /ORGANISM="Crypthecodinium cohnii, Strain Seligo" /LENGTH=568 /DNA_ID=CAMNT_0053930847 /DNA_START=56 /DNA_END=1762 /DNA_ORIENTATION=-
MANKKVVFEESDEDVDEEEEAVPTKKRKQQQQQQQEDDGEEGAPKQKLKKSRGASESSQAKISASDALEQTLRDARFENARPIINKPIPPIPKDLGLDSNGEEPTTLALFYQYIEPPWTTKEHRQALRFVTELGRKHGVTGRGRCAQEGLNCTMTGSAKGMRGFCQGLRDWMPIFNETDFKLTDGLEHRKKFKALTVRKVDELVAYGLEGAFAPSLSKNAAENLEADEYHKMMADPDAVIIDVRNVYESAIGHFQPPEGGAELIIPPVRHSFEFPRWFNAPETKEKLQGKKVMMYCTGGIRCERATALMDQIEKNTDEFETQGIYHCRGGIERYMKTFPKGGFWKGRNYLFDRRLEQVPELKTHEDLEKDVESWCSVCRKPWGIYRGAKTCAVQECKIPVIVCDDCQKADPKKMKCPLCAEGDHFALRQLAPPRLVNVENATNKRKKVDRNVIASAKRAKYANKDPSTRIFVGKLPLAVDVNKIEKTLGSTVQVLEWILDRETQHFYGSVFLEVPSIQEAKWIVEKAATKGFRIDGKRLRISFAPLKEGEQWPPKGHQHLDRPPLTLT